jgi:hypothetical protein
MRTRATIVLGAVLAAAAGSPGCGSSPKGNGGCPPGEDLCVSYCQHAFSTTCSWPTDFLGCVNSCKTTVAAFPTACMDAWAAALRCGSCAAIQCARRTCTPDGSACVEEGSKVVGCDAESAAFEACAGACLAEPITSSSGGGSSDGGSQSRDITTSRCACPATLEPGAAAGASCVTAGDCAQVCCACPTGAGRFVVRSCVNRQCQGDLDACAAASEDFLVASFCGG